MLVSSYRENIAPFTRVLIPLEILIWQGVDGGMRCYNRVGISFIPDWNPGVNVAVVLYEDYLFAGLYD